MAKRGRKSEEQREAEVLEALRHLHDLDWLHECSLASRPALEKLTNTACVMAEGQALRKLLLSAIEQTINILKGIPGYEGVVAFLEGYQQGASVTRIARDLGVRRENVFRTHRPKAFRLVARNFLKLLSNLEQ